MNRTEAGGTWEFVYHLINHKDFGDLCDLDAYGEPLNQHLEVKDAWIDGEGKLVAEIGGLDDDAE